MSLWKNASWVSMMLLISVLLTAGFADEIQGVQIYPGAKADAASTKLLKQMKLNGACYATSDSLAKVLEFYKKQPGLNLISSDKEGAMLKKGDVDITIQNPWMDMQTGSMKKTTLISIVKH